MRFASLPSRLAASSLALFAFVAFARSAPAPPPGRPAPSPARMAPGPIVAGNLPSTRQRKIELLSQGARKRFTRDRQGRLRPTRQSVEEGVPPRGHRARPTVPGTPLPPEENEQVTSGVASVTNIKVNDKTGDSVGSGQAEQSLAFWGSYGVCAWNDGQGFVSGGSTQGVGVTTDGGATWTDLGTPPSPPSTVWTSDPVITLNEKTGEFYYCGLFDQPTVPKRNGLGMVRGTFNGVTFTWDTPRVIRSVLDANDAIDKCWMVADSSTGNLYATYSHFMLYNGGAAVTDSIVFQRSSDNGLHWGPMLTMSSASPIPLFQGSRPAVGPAGEVYVVWYEIGPTDFDYQRVRTSTNQGASFGSIGTVATFYDNYGTGAPGFNRDRGVEFPSIAVDRSTATTRGNVYVAWNESVNWYNDPLGSLGAQSEAENNNTAGTANPFTPGRALSGTLSSSSDQDWYYFTATAGVSYIFVFPQNIVPVNMHYSMDVYCTNGTTHLAMGGDITPSSQGGPGGGQGNIVFTAPANGTYYFRMAGVPPDPAGSYTIYTGTNSVPGPAAERGRDQRDVFVARSTDGGANWGTPVRMNDDAALFDNWLPEVAVGRDGYPYAMWFDFRNDASCGARSDIYTSRSTDGGATWAANPLVTSASTNWTTTLTNIIPNQGDYKGLYSGGKLGYAWADGRLGDVDVFSAAANTAYSLTCPADPQGNNASNVAVSFQVTPGNPLFTTPLDYTLTSTRNWPGFPMSGSGVYTAGPHPINFSVPIPDTAASGGNPLCLVVSQPNGAVSETCCVTLGVDSTVGVPPSELIFALAPSRPNPATAKDVATIQYNLPRSGNASLRIYGTRGERVRTLVDGLRPAGRSMVPWDLRDDDGREVPSGVYYYRLEFEGQRLKQRLVVIR